MKATQDNAVWVSNNYKQGSSEDNWALADVKYRVPRIPLMVESATTTSATVHAPYGSPGATEDYVLYNSTDGEVPYTVSVSNSVATTLSSDNFVLQSNSNQAAYLDGIEDAACGVFTPDGSYAYLKSDTSGFWYKFGLATPYKLNNTSNTLDSTFQLTSLASEDKTEAMMVSYAAGGNYIYLWGRGQVVARYTLTTPYLMETATDLQTYDLTSYLDSFWGASLDQSGFVGFKVSADGTKGMSAVKLWGSTTGNNASYIPNYGQSFTLSTPFDLNTIKLTSQSNPLDYDGSNRFANAINFSESGDFIQGFAGDYQSNQYYRARYLNTPWDISSMASSYVTSEYINTFYSGSAFYQHQFSFLWNPVDNDVYVTSSQGSHYVDGSGFAVSGNPYPTATLTYTSAGLTAAPTAIYKNGVNVNSVSYAILTRADADEEGTSLAIAKASTGTSLVVYPPKSLQGSTALNGKRLKIDGTEFDVTTTTFTDNDLSALNTASSTTRSGNSRGSDAENTGRYVGAYQYDDPTTRPANDPNSYTTSMGMAFNGDGTKFFVSGYADNPNFSAFGGPSTGIDDPIVEWDLSTPWDLSSATYANIYDGGNFTVPVSSNAPCLDFAFNDDGTIMYLMNNISSTSYLHQGTLSTPYDLSTWTYSNHIDLYQLFNNQSHIYSFAISNDGKALAVFYSSSSGTLTSESYTKAYYAQLATPWVLSSATNKGNWTNYRGYRGSLFGDSDHGYGSFSVGRAAAMTDRIHAAGLSGDLTSSSGFDDNAFDLSLSENWVDNQLGTTDKAGKIIVVDGGTKLYVHIPQQHRVAMWTGAFGNFGDKQVIDISSLSLSQQPQQVEVVPAATYTSLGSASVGTSTELYQRYDFDSKVIDAEALRFKIEGDTDAEVTQFNVDLFT